jgi:hypothetical protein
MVSRGGNFQAVDLNLVGSSTFGRYPKISIEKSINIFQSETFMVPYAGYKIAVKSDSFNNGIQGRGLFSSEKFNELVIVIDANVYLVSVNYNQTTDNVDYKQVISIGNLESSEGIVYITENNKPQILISDNINLYIYDPSINPKIQIVKDLNFTPGFVTFHDGYFLAAASNDRTREPNIVNNSWRLSNLNEGSTGNWSSDAANVGSLQTKPDNVQAVVRFPSKGNMIFVMGSIVTEAWYNTGAQLFPYQRNNQFNIDYGCVSAATVAYMDTLVVWLAQNEKSGPIIMYSDGGMPKKITTDGIDFLFSELQNPEDSQGFLYRQDGHLFYHINFYSDNISLFYDFNTDKFYHACDQNLNYFIASEISFFGNQYYFVSKNTGNLYAFDTSFTFYEDVPHAGSLEVLPYQIPRIRTCKNIRVPSQDYYILNDVGFTIESGETDYNQQYTGDIIFITQDGNELITQAGDNSDILLSTQDESYLQTQDGMLLAIQQYKTAEPNTLIAQQQGQLDLLTGAVPSVDMAISYDGGASFGNDWRYHLPPIGKRRNKVMWWQCGIANDAVTKFSFWSYGRVVFTDGIVNIRK